MSQTAGKSSLFDDVVRITHVYLGPAADRFIVRQAQNHLKKEPQEMDRQDLIKLIDWIRMAVSLLTDDMELVEEYTDELTKLTKNHSKVQARASNHS